MRNLIFQLFLATCFLETKGYKITYCTNSTSVPSIFIAEGSCENQGDCHDLNSPNRRHYAIENHFQPAKNECCYTYYPNACYNSSVTGIMEWGNGDVCKLKNIENWNSVNATYSNYSISELWTESEDGTLRMDFRVIPCNSTGAEIINECPKVTGFDGKSQCPEIHRCQKGNINSTRQNIIESLPESTIVCTDSTNGTQYNGSRCGPGYGQAYCTDNCTNIIHPECARFFDIPAAEKFCNKHIKTLFAVLPFTNGIEFEFRDPEACPKSEALQELQVQKPTYGVGFDNLEYIVEEFCRNHSDTNGTTYNLRDAQLHVVVTHIDEETYNSSLDLQSAHIDFTLQTFNVSRIVGAVFVYKINQTITTDTKSPSPISLTITRYIAIDNSSFVVIAGWDANSFLPASNRTIGSDQLPGNASFVVTPPSTQPVCKQIEDEMNNTSNMRITKLQHVCRFFDAALREYSDLGCTTITNDVTGDVTCVCNHLTVFSVLMAMETVTIPNGVQVTSYTTGIASAVALIATIAILHHFKGENDRIPVQINLSVALLLLHAVNISHDLVVLHETSCMVFTVANHYCLLSLGFWFLVEGIRLLMATSFPYTFRSQEPDKRLKIFIVMGWIIPAFIVMPSAGVGFHHDIYMKAQPFYEQCHRYSNQSSPIPKYDRCWLDPGTSIFYTTVVAPLALVLLINLMIIVKTTHVIFNSRRMRNRGEDPGTEDALRAAKSFLIFFLMLGGTWTLAFFTGIGNDTSNVAFMYMHSLVNGLQGIVVFLLYCVMDDVIRKKVLSCKSGGFGHQPNTTEGRRKKPRAQPFVLERIEHFEPPDLNNE